MIKLGSTLDRRHFLSASASCLLGAAASADAEEKKPAEDVVFIALGDKPKTVKVRIISTYTDANHGMNFNGQFKGSAVYTIPTGWTVEVEFKNASPVPHSVVVVEEDMARKIQVGDPYWEGASSPKPTVAITREAKFSFVVDETGDYAFACGFPTHCLAGHWVGLEVSDDAKVPVYTVEGEKPVEAK